jgi:U3 small nucleolar RNA-associated protein 25
VLKANKIIQNNNIELSKLSADQKFVLPDDYRDQGFVRSKVLILLPFRESAYRVVKTLQSLLYKDEKALNFKRFEEEFGTESSDQASQNRKPEDYEKTFYGNIDDTFRVGMSFKGTSMKLYTQFESSDIVVASPLGLRVLMSSEDENHVSSDFLSSLEILVMDQMDVLLMQNWDHLLYIMEHLHLQPKSVSNTNFSRVRSSVINGQSKYFRQTLLFSSHDLPEFRSLMNSKCKNFRGKVRVEKKIKKGSIQQVMVDVSQTFHRIDVKSFDQVFDSRFEYFVNNILPVYKSSTMAHTMIYVPSYFDYVRIRNYLKKECISFSQISEYSKNDKISKARTLFYHGGAHFLLYSERAHYYRRFKIKGIRHVIFYQPPTFSNFYTEIGNYMHATNQNPNDDIVKNATIAVLYTKYDNLTLAGILGHEYVGKMLNSKKLTHKFSTK